MTLQDLFHLFHRQGSTGVPIAALAGRDFPAREQWPWPRSGAVAFDQRVVPNPYAFYIGDGVQGAGGKHSGGNADFAGPRGRVGSWASAETVRASKIK